MSHLTHTHTEAFIHSAEKLTLISSNGMITLFSVAFLWLAIVSRIKTEM